LAAERLLIIGYSFSATNRNRLELDFLAKRIPYPNIGFVSLYFFSYK